MPEPEPMDELVQALKGRRDVLGIRQGDVSDPHVRRPVLLSRTDARSLNGSAPTRVWLLGDGVVRAKIFEGLGLRGTR